MPSKNRGTSNSSPRWIWTERWFTKTSPRKRWTSCSGSIRVKSGRNGLSTWRTGICSDLSSRVFARVICASNIKSKLCGNTASEAVKKSTTPALKATGFDLDRFGVRLRNCSQPDHPMLSFSPHSGFGSLLRIDLFQGSHGGRAQFLVSSPQHLQHNDEQPKLQIGKA